MCPPKRMVRSRVSRVWLINYLAVHAMLCCSPRPACGVRSREALSHQAGGGRRSALVADRDRHILDLEFAYRLEHGPADVRVDLDLEVIPALQRLMVFLAEHHFALWRIELHAFHRADQF